MFSLLCSLSNGNGQFLHQLILKSWWNVEWVRRVFVLTYLIIPNSAPPNSSFEVGGLRVSPPILLSTI
jgi:hypothetical protein